MARTSVSSLLRAARAAQARQASLEDSIASYEFDLSPKDQAAFEKYSAYLNKRVALTKNTDPIKSLNYQKTLTSANRSFTSSEISRASTQVLYGNIDPTTKLNTIIGLYQRAVMNGDENLAQRLEGQAASLQNTILNAGRSGGGGGGTSAANKQLKLDVDNQVATLKDDLNTLKSSLRAGGNSALGQIEALGGGRTYFSTAKDVVERIANTYRQAADQTDDPNLRQDYLEKYNKIVSGDERFDIGFATGNKSLNDINRFIQERSLGSNPTRIQTGPEGARLVENKISGFGKYYTTPEGQVQFTNVRGVGVDADYERAAKRAQSNAQKFGVKLETSDGYTKFQNPVTGQEVIGTVDPYGNILYQGVDDQGNPIIKRYVTGENKDEVVSQQEQEALAKSGNAVDVNRAVLDSGSEFKRGVGQLYQKTALSKMFSDIGGFFGQLGKSATQGRDELSKIPGAMSWNPITRFSALQKYANQLKDQAAAKKAEEARIQAEQLRRATEEAARIVQQQRAAEQATRQRSVVFKAPTIDYSKITNPETRAITAINEGLRSPFGGNLYDLNRFR